MVIYDYWTGRPNEIIASLNRSVAQYIRNHTEIKIGITNHPERRFKQHRQNKDWDKMIVKYSTTSIRNVAYLEKALIEYHWAYITNQISGGGGPSGQPPYYLYVLLNY